LPSPPKARSLGPSWSKKGTTTLTFLIGNVDQTVKPAKQLAADSMPPIRTSHHQDGDRALRAPKATT